MKLRPSQRSAQAERICRRWIRRRELQLAAPHVYVIRHPLTARRPNPLGWGYCYFRYLPGASLSHWGRIILHVRGNPNRRELYILLAHEFTHYLTDRTVPRSQHGGMHGEVWQRKLWGVVPYGLWKRASTGRWIEGRSRHRPEYQPDRPDVYARQEAA